MRQFERLLHGHEATRPAIAELAERMGYQTDYLNRIFKTATGQTLREFRDVYLLAKARRLLRANRRVRDVSEALGFLDQNYFARWFKKHTGLPPRAYEFSLIPQPQGQTAPKRAG